MAADGDGDVLGVVLGVVFGVVFGVVLGIVLGVVPSLEEEEEDEEDEEGSNVNCMGFQLLVKERSRSQEEGGKEKVETGNPLPETVFPATVVFQDEIPKGGPIAEFCCCLLASC